jgi:hypothetical protein
MTVAFGYELKNYIEDDEKIQDYVHKSYKKLSDKEKNKSYHKTKSDVDVSPLFTYVKTIGEIYHGICLKVPYTADLNSIKNRLLKITQDELDVTDVIIWENKTDTEYKIYIECEEILKQSITEHGDLNPGQIPSEMYKLRKNK